MNKQNIITLGTSFNIPRDDIFLIIQKILEVSSKDLFLLDKIDEKYLIHIETAFQKRKAGVPLEHILGETEFFGYRFLLNQYTLIPKNDTEVLVEKTIDYISSQYQKTTLVDIGTGTGCIPISIFKKVSNHLDKVFIVDISPQVLEVTRKNISLHGLSQNIEVFEGDLLNPLENQVFDQLVVTANLPYIKNDDFKNIDNQVLTHEPHLALFGGKNTGFELYERLIFQLGSAQAKTIVLFIEIGFDQGDIVRNFCKKSKIDFQIFKDNSGIERCVQMKIC